jgi:uncharacterized protein YaeQ
VALSATVHVFTIDLSDSDRGVYEALDLRVARHPSESAEHLITRVLAYCAEYAPGIEFSRGIADPDDPAIAVRDLTGAIRVWIDIGSPDAPRLHRASKSAPRVVVFTHKDPVQLRNNLLGERIHRVQALEIYAVDRGLVGALAARLERRMDMSVAAGGGEFYVSIGADTLRGSVSRLVLD